MRAPRPDDRQPTEMATRQDDALRCHCGSLLARLVPEGVEIKCRRCKRRVVLPLDADPSTNQERAKSRSQARNS
jgi:phage FluMu protein Com